MKKITFLLTTAWVILLFTGITSCKKYLEVKPDIKLATPARLSDLQAILDNFPRTGISVSSGEASADNYFVYPDDLAGMDEDQFRIYTWQPDHLYAGAACDWANGYKVIYYANTVLDALPDIDIVPGTETERNNIKGQALMLRGLMFYNLASLWSPAYDQTTASSALGIPLRLSSDFNEKSVRSNLQESYDRAIRDLKESAALLPIVPRSSTRGSRPAAYAALSRLYLTMRNYPMSKLYADSSLQLKNTLINYNTIDPSADYPFSQVNAETLFYQVAGFALTDYSYAKIDTSLYDSYEDNDLRKTLFFSENFDGSKFYRGSYSNSDGLFAGLAVDEVYLNRAECWARAGNTTEAMSDLNTVLQTRYKTGTFIPLTATDPTNALQIILTERRKELLMRCLRFADIKRLNKEGTNIGLKRLVGNMVYTLPANDLRFALPLPEDVLALSGMMQNPR